MSQNLKKRQRLKQQKSRSDLKSSGGSLTASGHSNHHSSSHGANYLSPDRALNDGRLSVPNGGVRGRKCPTFLLLKFLILSSSSNTCIKTIELILKNSQDPNHQWAGHT